MKRVGSLLKLHVKDIFCRLIPEVLSPGSLKVHSLVDQSLIPGETYLRYNRSEKEEQNGREDARHYSCDNTPKQRALDGRRVEIHLKPSIFNGSQVQKIGPGKST